MSEPTSPPPPPTTPPPSGPTGAAAAQQVQGPAIGLIVTAVIGILLALLGLGMNALGLGMAGLGDMGREYDQLQRYTEFVGGGLGIVMNLIILVVSGLIIWAALEMQKLRRYTMAVVASVLAMIPCIGPCCIIGIPIGIWSLVVLMKPEVKAAFVS